MHTVLLHAFADTKITDISDLYVRPVWQNLLYFKSGEEKSQNSNSALVISAQYIAVPESDSPRRPPWREWSAAASADLCVWFRSGRNKFVQLLIRSRNSSDRFV